MVSLLQGRQRIVAPELHGGLGNRIFQVLAAQGYAEKHKYRCVLVKSLSHRGSQAHEGESLEPLLRLFPHLEVQDTLTDYETLHPDGVFAYKELPASTKNVVLNGFFQSERYFPTRVPSIRKAYRPHTYFIHIRAGDYLTSKDHYINLATYHARTIHMIRVADPYAKFLVFSNDNDYATHYLKQFAIPYMISSADDTLLEMASCAGAICANSSLSWLGAYFQRQPRTHVYMPGTWINNDQKTDDLYPSWATKVPVT